jgi:hypothetical protein
LRIFYVPDIPHPLSYVKELSGRHLEKIIMTVRGMETLVNLTSFSNLEDLSLGFPADNIELICSALKIVGQAPNLKRITLFGGPIGGVDVQQALELYGHRFKELERLRVSDILADCIPSIPHSIPCTLKGLRLYACIEPSSPNTSLTCLAAPFAGLASHPCRHTLRTLILTLYGKEFNALDENANFYSNPHQFFDPLFALSRLEMLQLNVGFMRHLDNSWLVRFANAWPGLQHLSIGYHRIIDGKGERLPRMTLAGLIPLVQKLPHLLFLGATVDARVIPSLGSITASNRFVERVDLMWSPIEHPRKVARMLRVMFPHLERTTEAHIPYRSFLMRVGPGWAEVDEILRKMVWGEYVEDDNEDGDDVVQKDKPLRRSITLLQLLRGVIKVTCDVLRSYSCLCIQ